MRRRLAVTIAILVTLTAAVAAVSFGQSGEYKIGVLEPSPGRWPVRASGTWKASRSSAT
jgi:hypothetical protein